MVASLTEIQRTHDLPGPAPLPLAGGLINALHFLSDPIAYAEALFRVYGPIASLVNNRGMNLYSNTEACPANAFIRGPELIQQMVQHQTSIEKRPLTGPLSSKGSPSPRRAPLGYLGSGLFGANGDEHRRQRRLLLPAFHKKRIEAYRDVMVITINAVLERLESNQSYKILEIMQSLTMQIVTQTLFDEDIREQESELVQTLWHLVALLNLPTIYLLPFDLPPLPLHRLLDHIGKLDSLLRIRIGQRRAEKNEKDRGDVLSMLLQACDEEDGSRLTEQEVLGHVSALFVAGFETSSSVLSWTLLLLTQHPDIAADLHDELNSVLHGEAPTVEQLAQLPLLEYVVKESMRLLPPVSINWSVLGTTIELGGYSLLPGTEIYTGIYHTHHMPELYTEPQRFNPRRWEHIRPTPFEYLPFGAGPRMCIGASFALLEIKLTLAILLQRYRLQCPPHLRVDRSGLAVLAPKGGLPLLLYAQDRQFTRGVGGLTGQIRAMVTLPD